MKKKNKLLIFLISILGYCTSMFLYNVMIFIGSLIGNWFWIGERIIEIIGFFSFFMVSILSEKLNKEEIDKYRCYVTAGIIYTIINVINLISIAFGTKFDYTYIVFLVVGIVYIIKGHYGKKDLNNEN